MRVDLMRWRPSEPAAEMIASFRDDQQGFFAGLDASGSWYAVEDENGVLSVRPLFGTVALVDDAVVDEPWESSSASREAVAVRVAAMAWHSTEPGQLAWLTCWGTPGGSGTIYTLDVADGSAEPVPVHLVERVCAEDSGAWLGGWGAGAWLEGWGSWGFALVRWVEERLEFVLLDVDGAEVVSIGDDSGDIGFYAGSGGTILQPAYWERRGHRSCFPSTANAATRYRDSPTTSGSMVLCGLRTGRFWRSPFGVLPPTFQ